MHYRPQQDAKALTSYYYNFQDDPSSEYGEQNCREEAKTLLEGGQAKVEGVAHGNRKLWFTFAASNFANGPRTRKLRGTSDKRDDGFI